MGRHPRSHLAYPGMPLDLDRIQALGQRAARAHEALVEAFDLLQAAYETGERVNIKQFAELLGIERKTVYNVLDRRGVDRLHAA
jgi:transcriptional regulator of acetoin/glycerol metabolism